MRKSWRRSAPTLNMLLFRSSVPECSAWNIHLYVTKKCGKRRFLWIVAYDQAITEFHASVPGCQRSGDEVLIWAQRVPFCPAPCIFRIDLRL